MAIKHLTTAEFASLTQAAPLAMVDFWASWCGPCKMLSPTVEAIAQEYDGKVLVGKVNVDEEPELARQFGVMSIPTVVFLKNGVEFDRKVGVMPGDVFTGIPWTGEQAHPVPPLFLRRSGLLPGLLPAAVAGAGGGVCRAVLEPGMDAVPLVQGGIPPAEFHIVAAEILAVRTGLVHKLTSKLIIDSFYLKRNGQFSSMLHWVW